MTAVSGVSGNTGDTETLIAEAREWVQEENWETSYESDGFNRPGTYLITKLADALEAVAVPLVVDRYAIIWALVKANNDYSHGVLSETQNTSRLDYLADAVVAVLNEGIR